MSISNEFPSIPESYVYSENDSRFRGASWFEAVRDKYITIAGLGGIGSFASFLLARTRPRQITLYDKDCIEESNLGGQLYSYGDLGEYKGDIMGKFINKYADFYPIVLNSFITESSGIASPILVCGFDNMYSRRIAFRLWYSACTSSNNILSNQFLYIDGRMAAEHLQVFCIRGNDTYNADRYIKEFLFDDSEAENTPCNYKQTSFMSAIIGGIITNLFVNYCHNCLIEERGEIAIERQLPFLTTYDAASMMFTTEY